MNLFKSQTTRPTSGQFIAIWMHDGKLWANTYRYESGYLQGYNEIDNVWEFCVAAPWPKDTIFFTE